MTGGQKDRTNQETDKHEESAAVRAFTEELKGAKIAFGQNRLSDLFTWLVNFACDTGSLLKPPMISSSRLSSPEAAFTLCKEFFKAPFEGCLSNCFAMV